MKLLFRTGIACCVLAAAQTKEPLHLTAPVADKNFYLMSLMERTPEAIENDATLSKIAIEKREALAHALKSCDTSVDCFASAMKWSDADLGRVEKSLRGLYRTSDSIHRMVDGSMVESGAFIRSGSGEDLLAKAWTDAAKNMNRIVDVYALGVAPRYPQIDSPSYDVKSKTYGRLVRIIVSVLEDQSPDVRLFFEPTLRYALALLEANNRDEAGRFEPLEAGENKAAIQRARNLDWKKYPYSAIIVPGAGGEKESPALSAWGKLRLTIAVRRYREGQAPFLIVSGGFVHPNQTPHCEAIEMKKSLIADFGIPADAILVDPHARHTTTNLRNAARELYRYGLPFDKPALISTDPDQSVYIESDVFLKRSMEELGYSPAREMRRVSAFDLTFVPNIESLQLDAQDPLDP